MFSSIQFLDQDGMKDRWEDFLERFQDETFKCSLREQAKASMCCVSLYFDKYSDSWAKLHRIGICVDDLLGFFPDFDEAELSTTPLRKEVRRMKMGKELILPSDEMLEELFNVYQKCISTRCSYLKDSPWLQERLLDTFCVSNGMTTGVFCMPNYPWIMASPDIAPLMLGDKSVIIHCEIVSDYDYCEIADPIGASMITLPKGRAVRAGKRKVCAMLFILFAWCIMTFPNTYTTVTMYDVHYEATPERPSSKSGWPPLHCQ